MFNALKISFEGLFVLVYYFTIMASKPILLLLIVTFTVQKIVASTCPNGKFIEKHVFKGAYDTATLKELKVFAGIHAHDRLKPVRRQTVYLISDNLEIASTRWSNINGICKWRTIKTKYTFARKWTCRLQEGLGKAEHDSKPEEPCPKPNFMFICNNCQTKHDVEEYANKMENYNKPVGSNLVFNVTEGAEWERSTFWGTCRLKKSVNCYLCTNSWHKLEGPLTGNGGHLVEGGHLVDD